MADDLGLTIGSYSAIENGKVKITIDRLQQIAEVLQKPMIIFLPSSALSYTFNVSHCDHAITAATYNNYQNKEMSDAVHQALQLMQMVANKMQGWFLNEECRNGFYHKVMDWLQNKGG